MSRTNLSKKSNNCNRCPNVKECRLMCYSLDYRMMECSKYHRPLEHSLTAKTKDFQRVVVPEAPRYWVERLEKFGHEHRN